MNDQDYITEKKKELTLLEEEENRLKTIYNDAVLLGDTDEMERIYQQLTAIMPKLALLRSVISDPDIFEYYIYYQHTSNSSSTASTSSKYMRTKEDVERFINANSKIYHASIYHIVGTFKPTLQFFDNAIIKDDRNRKEGNPHHVFHEVYQKERKPKIQL